MKRRDFIKMAGVAAVTTVGITTANAACKTINGYVSWSEIMRVTKDFGFGRNDLDFPMKTAADETLHFRKHTEEGDVYLLGFNRISDFKGQRYTYAWMEKHTPLTKESLESAGPWKLEPLGRGLLDPTKWEEELRGMIYSSFVQGRDAE